MPSLFALLTLLFLPLTAHAQQTAPIVGVINPSIASSGVQITLKASFNDPNGKIQACFLFVDGVNVGNMGLNVAKTGTASKNYTFQLPGSYRTWAQCTNDRNESSIGSEINVVVSSPDPNPPVIDPILTTLSKVGTPVTLTTKFTEAESAVVSCNLFIDGFDQGNMSRAGTEKQGTAYKSYTFQTPGPHTVRISCTDKYKNVGQSPVVTLNTAPKDPSVGSLIKMICPLDAKGSHPCHGIYYIGQDRMRHAFPNEDIFFSWFANYTKLQEVTSEFLAAIPLGKSVVLRPGSRLIKFETSSKVFAQTKNRGLRWITSEAIATRLYGKLWWKKIDILPDAAYNNYLYGPDITSSDQFDPVKEGAGTTIDANL